MKVPLPILLAAALAIAPSASAVTVLSGSTSILGGNREKMSKDMREGIRLMDEGFDEQAFEKFTLASDRGELSAHFALGTMHRDGRGTLQNIKLAKQSFEKASAKDDPIARQELELLRFVSPENPEEFSIARKRLELFALDGMSRSQLQLGLAYLEGYGFEADAAKAVNHLADAAKSNGPAKSDAAFQLGMLYRSGHAKPEVKKNAKVAEAWLKAAAEADHAGAIRALGEFYLADGTGKQDFARARVWFSRLEHVGDPSGLYYLGQMSENGWGVEKDDETALGYYRKAAAENVPLAVYKLAEFHENGRGGLEKDERKAVAQYRKGAELGHPICMYNLSVMLDRMDEHPPLKAEVLPWLLRAAAGGLNQAEYQLGARYQQGRGVQQDFVAAAAWFDRAARSGHALAQLHLGEMYENGHGVKRDYASARRLFELSAKGGNVGGQVKYAVALANGVGGEQDIVSAYVYATTAAQAAPESKIAIDLLDAMKKVVTPEQLAEAEKHIAELQKTKAVE